MNGIKLLSAAGAIAIIISACASDKSDRVKVCVDADSDLRGVDCFLGPDADDNNPNSWTNESAANCLDADGDGYYAGCDRYADVEGPDYCASDPFNWSETGCGSCIDADGDGAGVGCDLGPDCDDGVADYQTGCGECIDADGDGHDAPHPIWCPAGDDDCPNDPNNWSPLGCTACVDADLDGYGEGCDLGPDCADGLADYQTGCGECIDADGDEHDVPHPIWCPAGDDNCPNDPNNWSPLGCTACIDADLDGFYAGCDGYTTISGPDSDDGDPNNWTSAGDENCADLDGDSFYAGCDGHTTISGPDADDSDPNNWTPEGVTGCIDIDGDSYYAGCDSYSSILGPDADDADIDNWTPEGVTGCTDVDGDNYYQGCDAYTIRSGPDHCEEDGNNWTAAGCANCIDDDGDGYGAGCDRGTDCTELEPTVHNGCGECADSDGDGHDDFDTVSCTTGDDSCPNDPNNWSPTGCTICVDADGDGYGAGCDLGPDAEDTDINNWTPTGVNDCVDADGDTFFVNCDLYTTISGPDADDADPNNWTPEGVAGCADADSDGWHANCDDYVSFPGPDFDDNNLDLWIDFLGIICTDADGDGYAGAGCAVPDDCNDTDPYHWADCGVCVDKDGDKRGAGCDIGPDCNDNNPNNWVSCGNQRDKDGDGWYIGLDNYVSIQGPDCDDDNNLLNLICFEADELNLTEDIGTLAADLDGDGDIDTLRYDEAANTLTPYRNDGYFRFTRQPADWITRSTDPGRVFQSTEANDQIIDFDNDGDLDISVSVGDVLKLFLNDGSGSFAYLQDLDGQLADFDGDNLPDLYFVSGTEVVIMQRNGGVFDIELKRISFNIDPVLNPCYPYYPYYPYYYCYNYGITTIQGISDFHIIDFDGDGDNDLVLRSYSDDIYILENIGGDFTGSAFLRPDQVGDTSAFFDEYYWEYKYPDRNRKKFLYADVNGDDLVDIIDVSNGQTLRTSYTTSPCYAYCTLTGNFYWDILNFQVYINDGSGSFYKSYNSGVSGISSLSPAILGDFNGDSLIDVHFGYQLFENVGGGYFQKLPVLRRPISKVSFDINGVGKDAGLSGTVILGIHNGKNFFAAGNYTWLKALDFNADHKMEILAGKTYPQKLYLNDGGLSFSTTSAAFSTPLDSWRVDGSFREGSFVIGDFNNDNFIDIANYWHAICWDDWYDWDEYIDNVQAFNGFNGFDDYDSNFSLVPWGAADMDQDGFLDLIGFIDNFIQIAFGRWDIKFERHKIMDRLQNSTLVTIADYDNDGDFDFLGNVNDDAGLVLENDGVGNFDNLTTISYNPNCRVDGDFNNDGRNDWFDRCARVVHYGVKISQVLGFLNLTSDRFSLVDLNGDGYPEITYTDGCYEKNAMGQFTSPKNCLSQAASYGSLYTFADVDGDGAPDLLAATKGITIARQYGNCKDKDGDGFGPFCASGPDCDDNNPHYYTGCGKCLDSDGDRWYGYDPLWCPNGIDYCDNDPSAVWNTDCLAGCSDLDGDGHGLNCPDGPDLCDYNPLAWTITGCSFCVDLDGDHHGDYCDTGFDYCEDDIFNWSYSGCTTCTDADGDGYRDTGCDLPEDFCAADPANWTVDGCFLCADSDGDGFWANCDSYTILGRTDLNDGDPSICTSYDFDCDGELAFPLGSDCDDDGDGYFSVLCGGIDVYDYDDNLIQNIGNGEFEDERVFGAGNYPLKLVAADVDRDGDFDIITSNYYGDTIGVSLNNGYGEFAPQVEYYSGDAPNNIAVSDLDGDGNIDVAAGNAYGDSISIFSGSREGVFTLDAEYANCDGPYSINLVDLDKDGDIDLTNTCSWDNQIAVMLNDGTGAFDPAVLYYEPSGATDLITPDINDDGFPDLVAVNYDMDRVLILINYGDGTFAPAYYLSAGDGASDVKADDIDSDGDLDLIATNSGAHSVSVFLNNGVGSFAPKVDYKVGVYPIRLHLADLNKDGGKDLVIESRTGMTIDILLNAGGGYFKDVQSYSVSGYPYDLVITDLNGDTFDDIVSTYDRREISIFINDRRGGFGSPERISLSLAVNNIVTADFDGNRALDLAMTCADDDSILVLPGKTYQTDYSTFNDADGDGLSDFIEVNIFLTDPDNNDSDSDGLSDYDEVFMYYSDPNLPDTDADGLTDFEEFSYGTDMLVTDTDGDGLSDYIEIAFDGDATEYRAYPQFGHIYSDTNPLLADTDGDTADDYSEIFIYNTSPIDPNDSPGFGESIDPNTGVLGIDYDGDGLVGAISGGSDCNDYDSNNTDIPAEQLLLSVYTSDNDTLSATLTSLQPDGSWLVLYSKTNGGNGTIYNASVSCPLAFKIYLNDTEDNDVIYYEYSLGSQRGISAYTKSDIEGTIFPIFTSSLIDISHPLVDSDNDQLSDLAELSIFNTNINLDDTDGDGYVDGHEYWIYGTDPANPLSPDPTDSDGDGLSDWLETHYYKTSDLTADTDEDGLSDYEELIFFGTDPLKTDTDSDKLSDYDEVAYNGDSGDYVSYPNLGADTDPLNFDTDFDGYPDGLEVSLGSDPLDQNDTGMVEETFNDRNLPGDWGTGGDSYWSVTYYKPYDGFYCLVAGYIPDGKRTRVYTTKHVNDGEICFYYKTTSQDKTHLLRFDINYILKGFYKSVPQWERACVTVKEGTYFFEWEFVNSSGGSSWANGDAYIDLIQFP